MQGRVVCNRLRHPDELRRFLCQPEQRHFQLRQMRRCVQRSSECNASVHRDVRFPVRASAYSLRQRLRGHQERHEQLRRVRHDVPERAQRHCHMHEQRLRHGLQCRLHALLRRVHRYQQRQR